MLCGAGVLVTLVIMLTFCSGEDCWECCGGDQCGFTRDVPACTPRCYDVNFVDVMDCNSDGQGGCDYTSSGLNDGIHRLYPDEQKSCTYTSETEDYGTMYLIFHGGPDCYYKTTLTVSNYSYEYCPDDISDPNGYHFLYRSTEHVGSGSGENEDYQCRFTSGVCGCRDTYGGEAIWEPVWDCATCTNCENDLGDLVVDMSAEEFYYPNENCCPVPSDANYVVTVTCPNAVCVQTEQDVFPVAVVTPDPCGTCEASYVVYDVNTISGKPPIEDNMISCQAIFYGEDGMTKDDPVEITVNPCCTPCCNPRDGCPPDKRTIP
jgi:hypothetical protein